MGSPNDNERQLGDLVRFGVIESVDLESARCTVRIDDEHVTGPIPWLAGRAGAVSIWSPPTVGEQVCLLCQDGDVEGGLALPGVFSEGNPANRTDGVAEISFEDGALLSYDPDAHLLTAQLPAGGRIVLVAAAGVQIEGDLQVEGGIVATGDVVAGEVSLQQHVHTGVQAGAAKSGKPEGSS